VLVSRGMTLSEVLHLTPAQMGNICFYPRRADGELRPPRRRRVEALPPPAPSLAADLARLKEWYEEAPDQRRARYEQLCASLKALYGSNHAG